MATITITIKDDKVTRIRQAFGRFVGDPPVWTPATIAQVETFCKTQIRAHVENYEARIVAEAKHEEVQGETW